VNLNQGSAPFIFPKPHFSGFRFDSTRNNKIGCMYQFDICNNFIDFENFDYLNSQLISYAAEHLFDAMEMDPT
jgi:hypothetical protein